MLSVRDGRWAVKCNECPIRMDLGPAAKPEDHLRLPTGWLALGEGAHVCPQCAPKWMEQMTRAMARKR